MDPLSVTASIVTVIAAARSGVKGLQKLDRIWSGPQALQDLVSEVEDVERLLVDISDSATQNSQLSCWDALLQSVECAGEKLDQISRLVTSVPAKVLKLGDAGRARLVMFRYQDRIKCLRNDLRVIRMDLGVRLSLLQAYASQYMAPNGCFQCLKLIPPTDLPRVGWRTR